MLGVVVAVEVGKEEYVARLIGLAVVVAVTCC